MKSTIVAENTRSKIKVTELQERRGKPTSVLSSPVEKERMKSLFWKNELPG
jgi:hypothetical protein